MAHMNYLSDRLQYKYALFCVTGCVKSSIFLSRNHKEPATLCIYLLRILLFIYFYFISTCSQQLRLNFAKRRDGNE